MKALGLDPGPSKTGAALIEITEAGWPWVIIGGHYENEGDELRKLIQRAAMDRAVIGVEQIIGYAYEAKRVAQLIETSRVEGLLIGRACSFGAHVIPICARNWRGELCGSPTASDEQIRIAIEGICKMHPKVKATERPHMYDAIGVALAAYSRAHKRTITLPANVMMAVHKQRVGEKSERGARKAAGLPAVEPTKRSPTRAQSKRRSEAASRGWSKRKAY